MFNCRTGWASCVALAGAMLLWAGSTRANLILDVRLSNGGKRADVHAVNDVLPFEVYAVVSGVDQSAADDAFQFVYGSLLSNAATAGIKGNLSLTLVAPFNSNSAQVGQSIDLDGDGDGDIGSNTLGDLGHLIFARASGMQIGLAAPLPAEFRIATGSFLVTALGNGSIAELNWRITPTYYDGGATAAALWQEDSAPHSPNNPDNVALPVNVSVGAPLVIGVPEPAAGLLLPACFLLTLARRVSRRK